MKKSFGQTWFLVFHSSWWISLIRDGRSENFSKFDFGWVGWSFSFWIPLLSWCRVAESKFWGVVGVGIWFLNNPESDKLPSHWIPFNPALLYLYLHKMHSLLFVWQNLLSEDFLLHFKSIKADTKSLWVQIRNKSIIQS